MADTLELEEGKYQRIENRKGTSTPTKQGPTINLTGTQTLLVKRKSSTPPPPPPSSKRFARSLPGTGTMVNFLISHANLLHDGDAFGLLTGGGPTSAANPTWVNEQADKLRAKFPNNTIFAQTSGLYDVDRLARGCKGHIDAIALVQETGFGVEDGPLPSELEKWDPAQAAVENRIRAAKAMCDAQGVDLILHMSGKGVPWRSDDIPTWDYSKFAAIVGNTFPNVIQTQRDFQNAHQITNKAGDVTKAWALVEAQIDGWLPQVTLTPSEVNGITHNTGGDATAAFLALFKPAQTAHPAAGISFWDLDAGPDLEKALQATLNITLS